MAPGLCCVEGQQSPFPATCCRGSAELCGIQLETEVRVYTPITVTENLG